MRINEIRPTLSGDVPRGYAFSSITSLTCTHFNPTIFLNFRKNVVVSHRVNEPIYLVHGTSFRVRPEKGNTGGHGASQRQYGIIATMAIRNIILTLMIMILRGRQMEILTLEIPKTIQMVLPHLIKSINKSEKRQDWGGIYE